MCENIGLLATAKYKQNTIHLAIDSENNSRDSTCEQEHTILLAMTVTIKNPGSKSALYKLNWNIVFQMYYSQLLF